MHTQNMTHEHVTKIITCKDKADTNEFVTPRRFIFKKIWQEITQEHIEER